MVTELKKLSNSKARGLITWHCIKKQHVLHIIFCPVMETVYFHLSKWAKTCKYICFRECLLYEFLNKMPCVFSVLICNTAELTSASCCVTLRGHLVMSYLTWFGINKRGLHSFVYFSRFLNYDKNSPVCWNKCLVEFKVIVGLSCNLEVILKRSM